MSGLLRSKQGCWTCRLRKKKCDEGRPHCSACASLSITCHGYGPKPDWMNDAAKERAVAKSIKEIVKHTSRRKTTTQILKQADVIIRIAPKASESSSDPRSSGNSNSTPTSNRGSSQEDTSNSKNSAEPPSTEQGDHESAGSIFSIPADESSLLMHFLDNIFPLQYPMYSPGFLQGGRGWLLALLLRAKAFYYAALALSAHHRQMLVLEKLSYACRVAASVKQETHLEVCLQLVNQFAQSGCPNNGLGIASAVVQLVFFELFTGGTAWLIHLRALMILYENAYTKHLGRFGLAEESWTILLNDLPLTQKEPATAEEVVSFRFLTGTIIWLDITRSITAGVVPQLHTYHSSAIGSNSQTRLEDIMGCNNWIMFQIGRIAALYAHGAQALDEGHFDCTEFHSTVADIQRAIQSTLAQGALEGFNISASDPIATFNTIPSDSTTLVTYTFAYMASIYLHLVTLGFHKLELVSTALSGAMSILQTRTPDHLLRALVCPLFVIGSAAKQEDQQFFRNTFSSPPLLNPLLKHREKLLPILEEIWGKRQSTQVFVWKDWLELTQDVLLL